MYIYIDIYEVEFPGGLVAKDHVLSCCGMSSIPDPGISSCCGRSQKIRYENIWRAYTTIPFLTKL